MLCAILVRIFYCTATQSWLWATISQWGERRDVARITERPLAAKSLDNSLVLKPIISIDESGTISSLAVKRGGAQFPIVLVMR